MRDSPHQKFHELRVSDIIQETADCKSVVFDVSDAPEGTFSYLPGQFITLQIEQPSGCLRRCYSLSSAPSMDDMFKITVKRVADGKVSNWINDAVKVGSRISVLPPSGRFVLRPEDRDLMLFAAGSGITPIISLIKETLVTTGNRCRLVVANRDSGSVIFDREIRDLESRFPRRLSVQHRFDDRDGFIRVEDVRDLVSASLSDTFFICGPGPFMSTVEQGLKELGVDASRIRLERFTSAVDVPVSTGPGPSPEGEAILFTIFLEGEEHALSVLPGQTLLDAAIEAGIDVPYSCMAGLCTSCMATLCSGEVRMADDSGLSPEDKQAGFILTCQSVPSSPAPITVRYPDF